MFVTLSYLEQNKRKQIKIPYYEIEDVTREIYEQDKTKVDYDFNALESKYTYFTPYLDYFLLQKEGKLSNFLMNTKKSIYGMNGMLYYYSKVKTRLHEQKDTVSYLCADDKSIMFNQRNINYDSILLPDGTSLSYKEAKIHDLLIHFYLHQVLSKNKEIAIFYAKWKQENHSSQTKCWFHDIEEIFLSFYLSVIRYVDMGDQLWYISTNEIETDAQTKWLVHQDATPIHAYRLNEEQIQTAKQLIKSFS